MTRIAVASPLETLQFNPYYGQTKTFPVSLRWFSFLTSHLSAGKQQHFRPITHSRLHQLHDIRFRDNICAHTAEEARREMGGRHADWATSDSFALHELHDDDAGCDQDGAKSLRQLELIVIIIKSAIKYKPKVVLKGRKEQQKHQRLHTQSAAAPEVDERDEARGHGLQPNGTAHVESSAPATAEQCEHVHCEHVGDRDAHNRNTSSNQTRAMPGVWGHNVKQSHCDDLVLRHASDN
jgi:hypothetical protein